MLYRLYLFLLQLWDIITSPFRSHACGLCDCSDYSDEEFFMWMTERSTQTSYPDEMLAANIVNRPLKCSRCKHPREKHGSLKRRLLTFDYMPNGGVVYVEHYKRESIRRKERRFDGSAVRVEDRPKVEVKEEKKGEGLPVKSGDVVRCHYDAFLKSTMEKFESSRDGRPFEFTMGSGQVVAGWEMGLRGVRKGGKRRITVPPELAYRGKAINGERNATIVFVIEVLALDSY